MKGTNIYFSPNFRLTRQNTCEEGLKVLQWKPSLTTNVTACALSKVLQEDNCLEGFFSNRELTAHTLKEYSLALILVTAFKITSSAKELNVHSTNLILPALPVLTIPATFTTLRMEDHATTSDK